MKIIEEIEKSRLTDENMAAITGGFSSDFTVVGPEQCNENDKYNKCHEYEIRPCLKLLTCSSFFWNCTGKDDYSSCSHLVSTI